MKPPDDDGRGPKREGEGDERESTASRREGSRSEREELARLRAQALRAQDEAREATEDRERVLLEMREVNEKLLVATVRAEEAADEADAARAEIAKSEERFRSLVTTSAAVVWYADAEGVIHVDLDSWRRFTGLNVEDARAEEPGWGWLRAVHPEDRDPVREAWAQATAARSTFTHQHRLRRRDGSYAWVVSRAVAIPRSGAVQEWIGMMTDISDRIRVEEAREQFIGILGHDLRNPLGAISMGVELLMQADLPAPAAKTIARIGRSAQRIEAMIRDVLDFARGRLGGGIPIKRGTCDLGRICADTVEEMKQAHPERNIDCEAVGDLEGEWDSDRVEQVLSNLVGNAIQHGEDPIGIVARGQGDHVTLSITNRGPPIPSSVIPKLFEPFHRRAQDGSTGLGLGLYIVSEIVRAHGGTIDVCSSGSEGTAFRITWPRIAPAARLSPTPVDHPAGPIP